MNTIVLDDSGHEIDGARKDDILSAVDKDRSYVSVGNDEISIDEVLSTEYGRKILVTVWSN